MLLYCYVQKRMCRNAVSKNMNLAKTNKGKLIILSKCTVHDSKKLRFIKKQQAGGLLSSLRSKTPLSNILVLGGILFQIYKINEIVNMILVARDKLMPEMHLRQSSNTLNKARFTQSSCGSFTKKSKEYKHLKRNKKFMI